MSKQLILVSIFLLTMTSATYADTLIEEFRESGMTCRADSAIPVTATQMANSSILGGLKGRCVKFSGEVLAFVKNHQEGFSELTFRESDASPIISVLVQRPLRRSANMLKPKMSFEAVAAVFFHEKKKSWGQKFGEQMLNTAISSAANSATGSTDNSYAKDAIALGKSTAQGAINNPVESGLYVIIQSLGRKKHKKPKLRRYSYFKTKSFAILEEADDSDGMGISTGMMKLWAEPVSNANDKFVVKVTAKKNDSKLQAVFPAFSLSGSVPIFQIQIKNISKDILSFSDMVINYIPKGKNPLAPCDWKSLTGLEKSDLTKEKREIVTQIIKEMEDRNITQYDPSFRLIPGYSYNAYLFFDYDLTQGPDSGELVLFNVPSKKKTGKKRKSRKKEPKMIQLSFNVIKGPANKIGMLGKKASKWEARFEKKKKSTRASISKVDNVESEKEWQPPKAVEPIDDDEKTCEDGIDNDRDGWIDDRDPDCVSGHPESKFSGLACNDNIDNDLDGAVDSEDPDCKNAFVKSEGNFSP